MITIARIYVLRWGGLPGVCPGSGGGDVEVSIWSGHNVQISTNLRHAIVDMIVVASVYNGIFGRQSRNWDRRFHATSCPKKEIHDGMQQRWTTKLEETINASLSCKPKQKQTLVMPNDRYEVKPAGGRGRRDIGQGFDRSLWPGGRAFELSCCPGDRDTVEPRYNEVSRCRKQSSL